jgi:release factor glutamine methyltransferase
MTPRQLALVALGQLLRREGYVFITATPETHARVNARAERTPSAEAPSLRDIFGWNRAFSAATAPPEVLELLERADALERRGAVLRAQVRFSTLGTQLFAHSEFPTVAGDAVFFGPDTYRFCALLRRWAPRCERAIDLGCGSGAGAIAIGAHAQQWALADVNPRALELCEVNAALNELDQAVIVNSDLFAATPGSFDLIVCNPPYMRDELARTYRDGGGPRGERLGARVVEESLSRLRPGGTLIVYTGSAIIAGRDSFQQAITPLLEGRRLEVAYEELDPDVFGEELDRPGYVDVERIAAVGLRVCVS